MRLPHTLRSFAVASQRERERERAREQESASEIDWGMRDSLLAAHE